MRVIYWILKSKMFLDMYMIVIDALFLYEGWKLNLKNIVIWKVIMKEAIVRSGY